MNQLLSLAMRFRTRFYKPFLKEKIGLNPRSWIWLTRQIRTKSLNINQSRGSGCRRQVKVALTLIADAKLRERQARVALTMIMNEKLGARRARIANPVKARAALMTRKAMTNSLSFVKKLKRMKCAGLWIDVKSSK